jgi:Nuclease-related domain
VPGSKANLDHLLIGPTGVFYVDAKRWQGTLRLGRDGRLWHNGRSCAKRLRTIRWEAQQVQRALADLDVRVRPVVVILDAALPAPEFMVDGIMIVQPSSLRRVIRSAQTRYDDTTAAAIAQRARTAFRQAR